MTERQCVIDGCRDIGQHLDDCTSDRCRGCRPRICENPIVCNSHRTALAAELADIPDLHAQLVEDPDPVDRAEWIARQRVPVPTTDPGRKPGWMWARLAGRDELAQHLPMGIVRTSHQARVSGTREQPAPINLDQFDLAGQARHGSIEVVYRGRWGHAGGDPDQIGHLAVATELDFWVRDWIGARALGEHLPVPTVPELTSWLSTRLRWACDEHLGIDEFAAKVFKLRHAMRSVLGLTAAPKERCHGVACKSCDKRALVRDGSLVHCGYCGLHYSERDYREWVGLLAAQASRMAV